MRAVREALGENAIIVATRDDETGGIRVTAAIDDAPAPNAPRPVIAPAEPEGSQAIELIAEALTRHQVPNTLAERLLATATQFANDDPVLSLGAAFDTHFQFAPILDDKLDQPLMLVGPPGVGKTLCIAKFATRATMSKRTITVITTDTERAGGIEQLAAFTRLLKLNLVEIEDAHALHDMVAMQKGAQIYIDTAGRNPFIDAERREVQALITSAGGAAALVLPSGLDASEALDMANEFRAIGANRLIFTRVDMTRRLGSLLRIAFDAKLPLANFSLSGKVTEPPAPFNPVALARLILPPAAAKPATVKPVITRPTVPPQKQSAY